MTYEIDLSGRVAFVTGASSGLGEQFARTLSAAGAGVVLAARRVERLKTLRAEIESQGGDAHVVVLDVTDRDSIRAAVAHAETEMGAIDILVNNSGVGLTTKLTEVTPEDYDYQMNTNTRGAFFVAQEVAKRMIARSKGEAPGTYTGGRIVNIASMAGLRVGAGMGVYCMSKAAVVHMTRAMALEWGRFGINVNALCPGYIDTEINHHIWQTEAGQKMVQAMPRRRVGQPQDLDVLLMMLCSNQSHFINGAVIAADDGQAISAGKRVRHLTPLEARVLGVLVEKQATVPDTYPLSLNAIVSGCNQKTARVPVIEATEAEVVTAVDGLKALSLVFEGSGSRVVKFEHNMGRVLALPSQAVALMTVLMLRGPQTAAELRLNCERLHRFADISSVEGFLDELAAKAEPRVVKLPRAPGEREARWAQLLCGEVAMPPPRIGGVAPFDEGVSAGELAALKAEQTRLADELAALKALVLRMAGELGIEPEKLSG